MRNMAVLHSPAFSYPLPVLVRVLFNLLIFKGKILYYNKYSERVWFLYAATLSFVFYSINNEAVTLFLSHIKRKCGSRKCIKCFFVYRNFRCLNSKR